MKMFSIYDKKAMQYSVPFCAESEVMAIRMVEEQLENPRSLAARYPADFCLMAVGSFSLSDGKVNPLDNVVNVYECLSFFNKES